MLAFPTMLVPAAELAGIEVPPDPEEYENYSEEYPHFFVFAKLQLERRMSYVREHFDNAKVIAELSLDEVKEITLSELIDKGFSYPND